MIKLKAIEITTINDYGPAGNTEAHITLSNEEKFTIDGRLLFALEDHFKESKPKKTEESYQLRNLNKTMESIGDKLDKLIENQSTMAICLGGTWEEMRRRSDRIIRSKNL